ncbi:MAG: hypothetical protein WCS76_03085 [Bacilli bacterium]
MDDVLNQDIVEDEEIEEAEEMEELDDQYQEVEEEENEEEVEPDQDDDGEEEEETEEEHDEITYMGEKIKISDIPSKERIELLQKGKNYDKINSRLTEQQQVIQQIEAKTGMNINEVLQALEQQKMEDEIAKVEEEEGISRELAEKLVKNEREIAKIKEQQRIERVKINTAEEKDRLKNEPFFNDLYDEALKLVNPDVNLTTAFYFIRGQKLPELLNKNKELQNKSNIANVHDSRRRRGVAGNSNANKVLPTMSRDIEAMTKAFGNDLQKIASYTKKNLKK